MRRIFGLVGVIVGGLLTAGTFVSFNMYTSLLDTSDPLRDPLELVHLRGASVAARIRTSDKTVVRNRRKNLFNKIRFKKSSYPHPQPRRLHLPRPRRHLEPRQFPDSVFKQTAGFFFLQLLSPEDLHGENDAVC